MPRRSAVDFASGPRCDRGTVDLFFGPMRNSLFPNVHRPAKGDQKRGTPLPGPEAATLVGSSLSHAGRALDPNSEVHR